VTSEHLRVAAGDVAAVLAIDGHADALIEVTGDLDVLVLADERAVEVVAARLPQEAGR